VCMGSFRGSRLESGKSEAAKRSKWNLYLSGARRGVSGLEAALRTPAERVVLLDSFLSDRQIQSTNPEQQHHGIKPSSVRREED